MSGDTTPLLEGKATQAGDYDLLLYDYSKHLLSLALISIGGVLTLAQSSVGREIPDRDIGVIVLILAASGVAALSCTAAVLRGREQGRSLTKQASYCHQAAMGLLGAGFGYFLMGWLNVIFR